MLIQDVGDTFGGGRLFTLNGKAKMDLHGWSNKRFWNKVGSASAGADNQNPECQAELHKSLAAKDGLNDPTVSEEGRRFTAGLLCQLSDQQVTDLFRVARVAEMPKYHNDDSTFKEGMTEASIMQQWVTVFKQKREDVARGRCRSKSRASDLNLVDKPAGLSVVPNTIVRRESTEWISDWRQRPSVHRPPSSHASQATNQLGPA